MIKVIFSLLSFSIALNAFYQEINSLHLYKVKIKDEEFKTIYINLKDEILSRGFSIVHEVDLAKSSKNVADALKKEHILKNGKTLLICKASFAYKMFSENIDNITYCPMAISVYEKKGLNYISFRKYKSYKNSNKIAKEINATLKDIIHESLD